VSPVAFDTEMSENSSAEKNLGIIRNVSKQLMLYTPTIKKNLSNQKKLVKTLPRALKKSFGDQLKTVAV
jgi:hypothetical protein